MTPLAARCTTCGRGLRALFARVPSWVWYGSLGIALAPWIVRYFLAVIGQGCNWLMPPVTP